MIKWNRFVGFSRDEKDYIENFAGRQVKYKKITVKAVKCGCGMELYYRVVRCPACERTL